MENLRAPNIPKGRPFHQKELQLPSWNSQTLEALTTGQNGRGQQAAEKDQHRFHGVWGEREEDVTPWTGHSQFHISPCRVFISLT
jgi:hypothetical protein